MGNYATTAELQARFASAEEAAFATDTESTGTPSSTVLDDAIEFAEGEINSRIGKRYATPVVVSGNTELTALLKRKTLDIAEWHLLGRSDHVSEVKTSRYERAMDWADGVSEGKFILSGAATPPSTTSRNPLASWSTNDRDVEDDAARICTRETMGML